MSDPISNGLAVDPSKFQRNGLGYRLSIIFATSGDFLHGLAGAWRTYRDLANLDRTDDHLLRDIGLTRYDLEEMLAHPWWRRTSAGFRLRSSKNDRAA